MNETQITDEATKIRKTADKGGYRMHPDEGFVNGLVEGILTNRERYGYDSCPCRLATGDALKDRPIVCPCDYRDEDLAQYNACYCALYVSDDYAGDDNAVVPDQWDPDRPAARPSKGTAAARNMASVTAQVCQVCGYVAVKDSPPRKCPICGVSHERFTEMELAVIGE